MKIKKEEISRLSVVLCIHNEESQLKECLDSLKFADEIIILLDKCTDRSKNIARNYAEVIIEGEWDIEGERRNAALGKAGGDWILEIDADERISDMLAQEIIDTIQSSNFDWHEIPVDNYIGPTLVRWGWGASYGKAAYPGLFRNGIKKWGMQRVHPSLQWTGTKGPMLTCRLEHFVDCNISDMILRLDNYSTKHARDLRDSGQVGTFLGNFRRFFSRFIKCYFFRKGYREGNYGFLIALFAGLYPIISYLKAVSEED